MVGFFSMRLAPGVRISASPRGLRAHVGPRGTRVHVGRGGTGVSTGAGPFTYYQPVSPSRRRPRGGSYYSGPSRQQIAGAAKEEQAALIQASLQAIANIHRETFAPPARPTAREPALPPYPSLLARYEKQELAGVSWLDLAGRKAAKAKARDLADRYALHLQEQAAKEHAVEVERFHHIWTLLNANDPATVRRVVGAAFEDNEAPAAAVSVEGSEVNLVVLVPPDSVIPDRLPTTTSSGNLSLAKMNKTTTAGWHRELVAGHVVVSAKEALAVAPGLQAARVVAVRDNGLDVYGQRIAEPVLATHLTRTALTRVQWPTATAWDVVTQASEGQSLANLARTTGALKALDLSEQPDLMALVEAIDFE